MKKDGQKTSLERGTARELWRKCNFFRYVFHSFVVMGNNNNDNHKYSPGHGTNYRSRQSPEGAASEVVPCVLEAVEAAMQHQLTASH